MSPGLEPLGGTGRVPTWTLFRDLGLREVRAEKDEYLRRAQRRMLTSWETSQLKRCDAVLDELERIRFPDPEPRAM